MRFLDVHEFDKSKFIFLIVIYGVKILEGRLSTESEENISKAFCKDRK